jgi:large subunit ribosomal protein L9
MSKQVSIVLKDDVDQVGRAGETVKVRHGYARNYLIPQGLAVIATDGNLREVEHERRLALKRADRARKLAQGAASQVEGLVVEVYVQAGEDDKLFGSVTPRDVAEALSSRGIAVDRKRLSLPDSIRALGDHEITAKLGQDVQATFTVRVLKA